MKAFLIITALFGLLFLTSCAPADAIPSVYNTRGVRMGEVRSRDGLHYITDARGNMLGIVSGSQLVSGSGVKLGEMLSSGSGSASVRDARGKEVATIQQDTECYGSDDKLLGRINVKVDPSATGAACLLLLLP